jgi:ribosomal-protein-serine acetyltransferase
MLSFNVDEHITLELPQLHHAEEIAEVVRANAGRLQKWMPWAAGNYTVKSAMMFIEHNLNALSETGSFSMLIRHDGELAGAIGFHDYSTVDRSAHIGYWISKDFEGQGIITRCCRVLIDHLFDDLDLNRVQINCNVENTRSRAIPERLGFRSEGIQYQAEFLNGRFHDWAVYAMLREEWSVPPAVAGGSSRTRETDVE